MQQQRALLLRLRQAARQQQIYCQQQQQQWRQLRTAPAQATAATTGAAAAACAAAAAAAATCGAGATRRGFATAAPLARGFVQLRYVLGVGGVFAASQFDWVVEHARLSGIALVRLGRDVAAAAAIVAGAAGFAVAVGS